MIDSTLLNRYKIESELGKGGMGIVYKAHDALLNRAVAIKFLNTSGVGTEGKARLLQEARAAAQLNHPNIVSVYDAGEADGSSFIVMELVKGDTLRKTEQPNLPEALLMARQICLALDHAHSNGIIHRDLKLENIVITNTQTLKLMDFGLARTADDVHLTEEDTITGTFAYLAPELIQGQPASVQSDLYAFGVILYELLVGHAPFQGTINTVLAQHLQGKVTPPSEHNANIPNWVDDLVLRLLSKRPEERPASAKEVLLILEQKTASPAITDIFSISSKQKNNLPTQLTTFIGREKEIEEVKEAIKNYRLVTLTGSGGTGKTRLSLQVAAELLDQFEYTWFVELAPISDPDNVPQTILSTIGVSEQQGKTTQELLGAYLQDKNTLIVLDNCEHLIDASAKIAEILLNHAPALKILASSREALGVKGEMAWHVPSLSLPDLKHLPELDELSRYESIRLFTERATLVKSDFTATKENAPSIAQICSRLDGIPLAIELAASRVKALSVEQIAARLDDRFRLLTGGARNALPRQQTLRAAIDWSYNLLSEPERALLRHLTVFSGGWTLEAAESVCSEDGSGFDILDLLTQLVDKSLVNLKDSRYRILETTRQYAREKLLDSGEGVSIHDKHLKYFLDLAEKIDKEIHGPNQIELNNISKNEFDNFRTALEWSLSAQNTEKAARLLGSLGWPWTIQSHYAEKRDWFNRIRALPDVKEFPLAYAKLLNIMARDNWVQGNYNEAQSLLEECRDICLKLGSDGELELAEALDFSGMVAYAANSNYDKAELMFKQSFDLFQKHGEQRRAAECIFHIGIIEMERNQESAPKTLEHSLATFDQFGDLWGMARVSQIIGIYYLRNRNFEKAKIFMDQHLLLDEKIQFAQGTLVALDGLGRLHVQLGNLEEAERYYQKGLRMGREYQLDVSFVFYHMATLALHKNDYSLALQRLIESGNFQEAEMGKADACNTLMFFAAIAGGTGQLERAAKLYGAAQAIFDIIDYRLPAFGQKEFDRHIQIARDQLGETAFEIFSNEGRAMTLEQAIDYALEIVE